MRTHLQLLGSYFKLALMSESEYRANFWVQLLESTFSLIVALGSYAVVYTHTDSLGGWLPPQLLALMAVHLILGGIISFAVSPNMNQFLGDIQRGTLDFALTKPIDAQYHVSIRRFSLWKLLNIVNGIIVLAIALRQLQGVVGPRETLAFALTLTAGTIIIYCFWMLLATTAFWFVRVDNIFNIFQSVFVAGRWPVTLFPGWMRIIMTFIIPIAFAVTVPAEALIGQLSNDNLILSIVLALVMLAATRLFWNYAVKHYSGASA